MAAHPQPPSAPARYALFLANPMGQEDISVGQVLQAYKEVLTPFVQAYTIGPDKLHLTPPCVASGGLPALFDTTTAQRTARGRTAATLAAMGSKLLAGPSPPLGTPASLRPPVAPPHLPASAPAGKYGPGGPGGPGGHAAPAGPVVEYEGVPLSYQQAAADAAPAGGGGQPLLLSSGSGHAGRGAYSGFARSGGHGMALSEFSASASMDATAFTTFNDGFEMAGQPTGPLLAPRGAGAGTAAGGAAGGAAGDGFRPPTAYGSGPPLMTEHLDRREKRVGEADAEALAALRASRDRVMQDAQAAGAGRPVSAGGPAGGAGAASASASAAAAARHAAEQQERTRSQERARDSGLMLLRPLGPGAAAAPGGRAPATGVF